VAVFGAGHGLPWATGQPQWVRAGASLSTDSSAARLLQVVYRGAPERPGRPRNRPDQELSLRSRGASPLIRTRGHRAGSTRRGPGCGPGVGMALPAGQAGDPGVRFERAGDLTEALDRAVSPPALLPMVTHHAAARPTRSSAGVATIAAKSPVGDRQLVRVHVNRAGPRCAPWQGPTGVVVMAMVSRIAAGRE